MKYDCSSGCGPGQWAPPGAGGLFAQACGDQCVGGCDAACDIGCGDGIGGCDCCIGQSGASSGRILDQLCGCTGCAGEVYWSEWHNDPPSCEPCDCCGNYTGPNCCSSGCCTSPGCAGGCDVASVDFAAREASMAGARMIENAGYDEPAPIASASADWGYSAYRAVFDEVEEAPLK